MAKAPAETQSSSELSDLKEFSGKGTDLLREFIDVMANRDFSDSGKMDRLIEIGKKAEALMAERAEKKSPTEEGSSTENQPT